MNALTICSYCKRAKVSDNWARLADVEISAFMKFDAITHGICPECFAEEKHNLDLARPVSARLMKVLKGDFDRAMNPNP